MPLPLPITQDLELSLDEEEARILRSLPGPQAEFIKTLIIQLVQAMMLGYKPGISVLNWEHYHKKQ